jgi:hypothetical protein
VDDHSCRLVDNRQVVVFVHDLEGDRFGRRLGDVCLRDLVLDDVTGGDSIRGISGLAVDKDQVAFDQSCGGRAA